MRKMLTVAAGPDGCGIPFFSFIDPGPLFTPTRFNKILRS